MNNASEHVFIKDSLQRRPVANIRLDQTIIGVILVAAYIRKLDLRIIEVIEIIDNENLPVAVGEQTIDQV
jgi:hypothetical protein